MLFIAIIFWLCLGLLIYTQIGYGLLLWLFTASRPRDPAAQRPEPSPLPAVSVIVAAYTEQDVIAGRVQNLRASDYPAELLEVIVACDGSPDLTAEHARAAGADQVLELPRAGKVLAQDAGVRAARGQALVFSDANASWAPDAIRRLVAALADPRVAYVCGNVSFTAESGADNQEGLYWRYEMFLRAAESALASVTAGNGAIYAVRREAYMELGPIMSHDIAFPFTLVKRGWRAVYEPAASATEKMAPTIEGEFRRKRRMAGRSWAVVVQGRMFSLRGYGLLYALMILSHRTLRYLSPILHLLALIANLVLLGQGPVYVVLAALQLILVLAALLAPLAARLAGTRRRWRPLALVVKLMLVARYYVFTTASLGAGLWDYVSGRGRVTWEPVKGTR